MQFGNISRWYADLFKFQAAFVGEMIHLGVGIVPFAALANRVDQNCVSFERCIRELPAARVSTMLPKLLL